MKKLLIAISMVIVVSLVGIGVVLAQGNTSTTPGNPYCPNCPSDHPEFAGSGWMHEYMHTAVADALGISLEDYDSRHESGQNLYEIAEDLGINLDTLPELLYQARLSAMEAAFEDGALTEEQHQFFQERLENYEGAGPGGMMGFGGGYGRGRHGGGHMFGNGFGSGGQFNGGCHGSYSEQVPEN